MIKFAHLSNRYIPFVYIENKDEILGEITYQSSDLEMIIDLYTKPENITDLIINTDKYSIPCYDHPIYIHDKFISRFESSDLYTNVYMNEISKSERWFLAFDQETFDRYTTYKDIIFHLNLFNISGIYYKNKIYTAASIICEIPNNHILLDKIKNFNFYQNKNEHLVLLLIIEELNKLNQPGSNLLSKDEQIEKFIELSKLEQHGYSEKVPDTIIDNIKSSNIYKHTTNQLIKNGYGLSQTQQFNVLQSVGLLSTSDHILFNLADMGSGKTLMTVQTLYMLDLKRSADFPESVKKVITPKKVLLAPKISINSSWLDTFKLFYNVEEIDEHKYKLTSTFNNVEIESYLEIAPFTVRNNKLTVHNTIEIVTEHDTMIVDELHQLLDNKYSIKKFFDAYDRRCQSIYLSGTLSNLTVNQWYNFLIMFNTYGDYFSDETARGYEKNNELLYNEFSSMFEDVNNTIINNSLKLNNNTIYNTKISNKLTNKEKNFLLTYGTTAITSVLPLSTMIKRSSEHHTRNFDATTIETQNIQLFYEIVGKNAITASSTQIAEELTKEKAKKHESLIINTSSQLSSNDIEILKHINKIINDYPKYGNKNIALELSTAILNLNDGLSLNTIYDILNKRLESNTSFLKYMATYDVDFLKQVKASSLINQPILEDTEKFKIVKNIIDDKNNTYLIVVNDYEAMRTLSKALNIKPLTKKQTTDQLNYQEYINDLFDTQGIAIVPQYMIKSSLDLIKANVLIQYQLNSHISDIIQTQNRINRIGQTRDTKAYYIATDTIQENILELFLETYKNIKIAHEGIVELFKDVTKEINIVNNYLEKVFEKIGETEMQEKVVGTSYREKIELDKYEGEITLHNNVRILRGKALLKPEPTNIYDANAIMVLAPLKDGSAHHIGYLKRDSDLYKATKVPTLVDLEIKAFSEIGTYNDSFIISLPEAA